MAEVQVQEEIQDVSKTIEEIVFKIASIASQSEKEDTYLVSLNFQSMKLESVFIEEAAQEITKRNIIQGSSVQITKHNLRGSDVFNKEGFLISQVKILKRNPEKMKFKLFEELANLFKFEKNEKPVLNIGGFDKKVQQFKEKYPSTLIATRFSVSVAFGVFSAYFISKMVKAFALLVGAYLLSLQALSVNGFLTINWQRVRQFLVSCSMKRYLKVFGFSSLGYCLGFYIGMKRELKGLI